jgi:polyhydroxybutyrate depolymerase
MRARCTLSLAALVALACEDTPKPSAPSPLAEAKALVQAARDQVEAEDGIATPVAAPLFVPDRPAASGLPLLVFLHGLGGTGQALRDALRLSAHGSEKGFAYLAPEGASDYSGRQFWNATASCCNFDSLKVDHVAALREWIVEATRRPVVDAGRVYLIGYSNGGFLAHRAACELADLVRGIVSIAGAAPGSEHECQPSKPVSVLQIHGDRDPIVAYDGGWLFADRRRPRHPSARASVERWAKWNGCDTTAPTLQSGLDLDPRIPGAETEALRYSGCHGSQVELWTVRGGDHSSGLSQTSLEEIWQLIRREPPRGATPATRPGRDAGKR